MFIVLYKLVQSSSHLILFPFGYMVFNLRIQVFCNSDLHINILNTNTYTYTHKHTHTIELCWYEKENKSIMFFRGLLYVLFTGKAIVFCKLFFSVLRDKFILNHLNCEFDMGLKQTKKFFFIKIMNSNIKIFVS